MALQARLFSIFTLISLLSLRTLARDSQFFSKVTNNNYVQDPEFHTNQETVNKQEQQPTFIPQTQTGYGLYGHETPEATPTTFEPYATTPQYKTQSEEPFNKYPKTYTTQYYNTENNFDNTQNGRRTETRFAGSGYVANHNTNNNFGERQGMSDTRFMDGGRFYYDINSEKNYDANQYANSRYVESKNNWHNNRGYFGNSNSEVGNSFEGYQNQNQEQFHDNQQVFDP